MKDRTVLLYSGGLDSWLIRALNRDKIDVTLYINLHTRYADYEMRNLPNDVIIEEINLGRFERDDGIMPLRNMYFAMIASYYGNNVWLGQISGDRPLDKTTTFYSKVSSILTYLHSDFRNNVFYSPIKEFTLSAPFSYHTKTSLLRLYIESGGDIRTAIDNVRSCYNATGADRCNQCKACFRNWVAFYNNGVDTGINKDYVRLAVLPYMTAKLPILNRYYIDETTNEYQEAMGAITKALQL